MMRVESEMSDRESVTENEEAGVQSARTKDPIDKQSRRRTRTRQTGGREDRAALYAPGAQSTLR